MATATIYPEADVTADWDTTFPASPTTHFSKVDEGTGTPDDNDYNETVTADDVDEYDLQATPANLGLLTAVTVPVRARITDGSSTALIRVSLWRSGPVQVGGDIDLDGADFGGYGVLGTDPTTATWSGLSLTKAQADTLSVRFQFKTAP